MNGKLEKELYTEVLTWIIKFLTWIITEIQIQSVNIGISSYRHDRACGRSATLLDFEEQLSVKTNHAFTLQAISPTAA